MNLLWFAETGGSQDILCIPRWVHVSCKRICKIKPIFTIIIICYLPFHSIDFSNGNDAKSMLHKAPGTLSLIRVGLSNYVSSLKKKSQLHLRIIWWNGVTLNFIKLQTLSTYILNILYKVLLQIKCLMTISKKSIFIIVCAISWASHFFPSWNTIFEHLKSCHSMAIQTWVFARYILESEQSQPFLGKQLTIFIASDKIRVLSKN